MIWLIYCSTTRSTSTTPISDPSLPSLPEVVPLSLDMLWLFVLRPSCRGDVGRCRFFVKWLQVPREALEIAGMSINFRSGKFGYSPYILFLAKVMPKFFVNFGMTLLKKGHMGYLYCVHISQWCYLYCVMHALFLFCLFF